MLHVGAVKGYLRILHDSRKGLLTLSQCGAPFLLVRISPWLLLNRKVSMTALVGRGFWSGTVQDKKF